MDKDENTSNNNDKNNEKQQQLKEQLVQVDPNVTTKKKDGNTEDDNQVNETFNVSPKIEEKQENKDNLNDNGGNVSLLKAREDDKVSPQDHRKCEEAFKAANIDNLDDTQASNIYKYEYNLIKMARRDKESSVINIATEKCGLGETDADLLATELIDRFGKSQSNAQGDIDEVLRAIVRIFRGNNSGDVDLSFAKENKDNEANFAINLAFPREKQLIQTRKALGRAFSKLDLQCELDSDVWLLVGQFLSDFRMTTIVLNSIADVERYVRGRMIDRGNCLLLARYALKNLQRRGINNGIHWTSDVIFDIALATEKAVHKELRMVLNERLIGQLQLPLYQEPNVESLFPDCGSGAICSFLVRFKLPYIRGLQHEMVRTLEQNGCNQGYLEIVGIEIPKQQLETAIEAARAKDSSIDVDDERVVRRIARSNGIHSEYGDLVIASFELLAILPNINASSIFKALKLSFERRLYDQLPTIRSKYDPSQNPLEFSWSETTIAPALSLHIVNISPGLHEHLEQLKLISEEATIADDGSMTQYSIPPRYGITAWKRYPLNEANAVLTSRSLSTISDELESLLKYGKVEKNDDLGGKENVNYFNDVFDQAAQFLYDLQSKEITLTLYECPERADYLYGLAILHASGFEHTESPGHLMREAKFRKLVEGACNYIRKFKQLDETVTGGLNYNQFMSQPRWQEFDAAFMGHVVPVAWDTFSTTLSFYQNNAVFFGLPPLGPDLRLEADENIDENNNEDENENKNENGNGAVNESDAVIDIE